MKKLAALVAVTAIVATASIAEPMPASADTNGNSDQYEGVLDPNPSTSPKSVASSWWGGTTVSVNQRFGCTNLSGEPDIAPVPYCKFPYTAGWHQGIDINLYLATITSRVSGTVADFASSCLANQCSLGYLAIRTYGGHIIYLLHGTPANPFPGTGGRSVHVGDVVNVGDAVFTTGANGYPYSSGYHLHFEVHNSLVGSSTLTCTSEPTGPNSSCDDINPEQWLAGAICTSATHSITPASPQPLGTFVTLSASSTGCNPSYQFMIQRPGQNWTVLAPYQSGATWGWDSTNQPPGDYGFGVWVHDSSNPDPSTYDSNAGTRITFNPNCPNVSPVPSLSSPQSVDMTVYIYGTVTGATCTMPEFKFLTRPSTNPTWTVLKDWVPYGQANYYWAPWITTSLAGPATYYLGVWVRQHGVAGAYADSQSGDRFDAAASVAFVLNPDSCASVSLSGNPTSVVHGSGTRVTFTAVGVCPHPNQSDQRLPSYQFVMRPASQNTWQTVQGYSTSTTWVWNSTGAAAGTVYFGIWVLDPSSLNSYDALYSFAYQVT